MPSKRARQLRKNMTDAEQVLWRHLRQRQVEGQKFRRQRPIGDYIVDFVCLEKRLVIEIDGGQHQEQREYDQRRSAYLREQGYRVLRFWNNEVLGQTEAVMQSIYGSVTDSRTPTSVLPLKGEEEVGSTILSARGEEE